MNTKNKTLEERLANRKKWRIYKRQKQRDGRLTYQRNKTEYKTYFVVYRDQVKIGKSTNPLARLAYLQRTISTDLVFLGSIDGDQEKELHDKFYSHRICGEWFNYNSEIKDFIDALLKNNALQPLESLDNSHLY